MPALQPKHEEGEAVCCPVQGREPKTPSTDFLRSGDARNEEERGRKSREARKDVERPANEDSRAAYRQALLRTVPALSVSSISEGFSCPDTHTVLREERSFQ